MITAMQAASYISQRYNKETGNVIDEMKLHKLLYFAQREALVFNYEPMFTDNFVAWKYGPVMLSVRDAYRIGFLNQSLPVEDVMQYKTVFDSVFQRYSKKPSWSLSILTHGEYSWQKARTGLEPDVNGHNMMSIEDICKDADRIRMRRVLFE